MTSLCPGPVFMSPGFNQHSTPTTPTATPSEIDRKLRRQPFGSGREWPKDSPVARVYDVSNTSTSLILLNKRLKKKSHLRGLTENSGEIVAPDPERHLSDEPTINWQHHEQCFNYQPELYKPLRATLDRSWVVDTPRPFTVGSLVNPKRHTSCWSRGNDCGGRWGPPPRRPHTSASVAVDSELQSLSPVLNDPDLSPGERRYLYSIARIYSTAQMKALKQGQYFDLLYRELRKGYHTQKEYERYYNYLNIPRNTQIGRLNNYEEQKRAASAPLPRTSSQNTSERGGSPQRSHFPQHSSGRSWTSSSRFSSAASSRHPHDKHSGKSREGARSKMGHSPSLSHNSSQKEEQQEVKDKLAATNENKDDRLETKEATSPRERTRKKSSSSQSSSQSSTSSTKVKANSSGDSHGNSGEATRKKSSKLPSTESPERRNSSQGEEADSKKDSRISQHTEKDSTSSSQDGRSPREDKDSTENTEEFVQEGAVTTTKGKESPEDDDGDSREKGPPMTPSQNKDSESPETSDTTDSSTSEPESDRSDVASKDQTATVSISIEHAVHTGTGNNQAKNFLELIVNDAEQQSGPDKNRQEETHSSSSEDSSSTTSSSSKHSKRSQSSSSSKDSNRPKSSLSAKETDRPRDFSNNNLAPGYTPPHYREGVNRPVSRAGRENEPRQKEEETSDEESGESESDEESEEEEDMSENHNRHEVEENPTQSELLGQENKRSLSSKADDSQQARMGNVDSSNEVTGQRHEADNSHPTEGQSEVIHETSRQAAEKEEMDLSVEGRNSDVDRLEY